MPYPEYKEEDLALFIGFISMFMILSFAIIIPPLIKRIVHEKESGIKASMRSESLQIYSSLYFYGLRPKRLISDILFHSGTAENNGTSKLDKLVDLVSRCVYGDYHHSGINDHFDLH